MPLKFTPKKEDELSSGFAPLPPGDYSFTVLESSEVASTSEKNRGRMMVKLKLNVHGPNRDVHIYDYFADWFSEWKLKHFCEGCGFGEEYNAGEVDASDNAWQGRMGLVKVKIAPERVKDGKTYEAKNEVVDYVVSEKPAVASKAKPADDLAGDDIPF
jgi:hypothetical protein